MNLTRNSFMNNSFLLGGIQRFYKNNRFYCNQEAEVRNNTHFGYENVTAAEKAQKVHEVFENVAEKYDIMNDLMSGGIHRFWKDCFVHRLGPTTKCKYLDVAGGTGDITFRIIQHLNQQSVASKDKSKKVDRADNDINASEDCTNLNLKYQITVCDISQGMLDVGKNRAKELGYSNINWVCGDAQNLPFPDDSFDCYTIAFGMRNVVNIEKALHEAYRVLRPGGRFLCLEFSHVNNLAMKWLYDKYSFQVIPVMGQVIANDWKSYQYLVESIRKFPDQEEYKEMIEDASFRRVRYENLTFGVTSIHSGFKI